ncbi:MAG TPA: helix-turn-helix transcriptional regulator [Symbiobacteriaceae bacterium]|nr:helix-turn-helix transcriptional regulator [Symbiobacteriaceae bacterium]
MRQKTVNETVQGVATLLRSGIGEGIRVREAAAKAYVSAYHLSRVFKSTTGISPVTYLLAVRMEKAVELLVETARSITEISFDVGYNSLGTFVTRFRKWVGVSPSEFRALVRGSARRHSLGAASGSSFEGDGGGVVSGTVIGPRTVGRVYVGLFLTPFPQKCPVACACLDAPGPFRIDDVPPGAYYVLAAAGVQPRYDGDLSTAQFVASRGHRKLLVVHSERVSAPVRLTLRERSGIDLPILGVYARTQGPGLESLSN